MNKKNVIKFIGFTYAIAWTIQIIVSLYMVNHPGMTGLLVFQLGLAVCMFAPLLAALIAKADFRGMGWKPVFKGNIKWLLFAAYVMVPLMAIGGVLFYGIFPNLFDLSGSMLSAQGAQSGVDLMAKLQEAGLLIALPVMILAVIMGIVIVRRSRKKEVNV